MQTMTPTAPTKATGLQFLSDLWDETVAGALDGPELLRYRSNLLGADLRITNFGGGNTSSKIEQRDPIDDSERTVLWVKGSGGDLASITRSGFASLDLGRLRQLERRYRGKEHEDEMVPLYPLCAFGNLTAPPSIDTPLHAFLPAAHVDHLHPDWGIALAAAGNGRRRMEEFNERFGHRLVWLPWQRPGFELGMMLRRAVEENPECDGVVLGGHGLFTWGASQRACYLNTITTIDHLGQFVNGFIARRGAMLFGGAQYEARADRAETAVEVLPFVRGQVSQQRRVIATVTDIPEVMRFVNSRSAKPLARLGTSCPDHFVRTKIRPLYVEWDPAGGDLDSLKSAIRSGLENYRREYQEYYDHHRQQDSPARRDPNPTVVLIPGVGMFSFGKSKRESRITGEFYVNAIHVMEGATAMALGDGADRDLPQAGAAAGREAFESFENYVALPQREAFGIEYWLLEEAKLRRLPPEKEFSGKVFVVVGGASGIGREVARLAADRGAHVVVADLNKTEAEAAAGEIANTSGRESVTAAAANISQRESVRGALRAAVATFGGVDALINTAAIFAAPVNGRLSDEQWRQTLDVNVVGNYLLADEFRRIATEQNLDAAMVLTSSANAVVPKAGSEAYDVSKSALSHLIRELAISAAPLVRVNGISPATVVKGSTMFPRQRVIESLRKYGLAAGEEETTEVLRQRLAEFYSRRTLTKRPIEPRDCAEAILFLAGDRAGKTTGHLIPVDGGLVEAFLR
jgi:rhamnose utilization protein RhaD (predicted bifunctional aldolase and dehydrogenase)/NAD(P)-dependent dehydrogenase (short-subunit alcohol dehydrogenase family)